MPALWCPHLRGMQRLLQGILLFWVTTPVGSGDGLDHPLGSVVTSLEVSSQLVLSCWRGQACHLRGWDPLFSRAHSPLGRRKLGKGAEGVCGLQWCSGTENLVGSLWFPQPPSWGRGGHRHLCSWHWMKGHRQRVWFLLGVDLGTGCVFVPELGCLLGFPSYLHPLSSLLCAPGMGRWTHKDTC